MAAGSDFSNLAFAVAMFRDIVYLPVEKGNQKVFLSALLSQKIFENLNYVDQADNLYCDCKLVILTLSWAKLG